MSDPLYVFAYDIVDDRIRRRVASLLEDQAVRVQGSVFEVRMSHDRARSLAERLAVELDRGDSLRVYCLRADDLDQSMAFGAPPLPEAQDFYLL